MSQPVVLIVDDEPKIFHAVRRALHRESYELIYAPGGDEALTVLDEGAVDVIIADENMPGMQGNALLARCRTQWPDVVRMMLTGDARLETVMSAVNKGEIYRFFTKPCNEAELIVAIRDGLQMRALKFEAARLLATVRLQNETIRAMNAQDLDASRPASTVGSGAGRNGPAGNGSKDAGSAGNTGRTSAVTLKPVSPRNATGGTPNPVTDDGRRARRKPFQIEPGNVPDDVDKLLDEIRNELEKLDL